MKRARQISRFTCGCYDIESIIFNFLRLLTWGTTEDNCDFFYTRLICDHYRESYIFRCVVPTFYLRDAILLRQIRHHPITSKIKDNEKTKIDILKNIMLMIRVCSLIKIY